VKLSLKNANVAVLREAVKVAAAAGDSEHLAFLRGATKCSLGSGMHGSHARIPSLRGRCCSTSAFHSPRIPILTFPCVLFGREKISPSL
jgi:hypothetical protein